MLADDEVVRTAAASLFHKHPAVSSLHAVRPRHRVRQVKGQAAPLSERSSLVLVGHGAREPSGEMRISGYSYQDVARIIQSSSRIGQKIQTTAVVACGAGSDRRFPQALLQTLHRAGLETELHLWETAVQVAETGDVLSQDGARWRSGDHSKKLVLTVGRTGEIQRRDDRRNCTGQEVNSSDRGILGKGGKDGGKQKDQNQTARLGKKINKQRGKKDNKEPKPKINPRFLVYRGSWPQNPKIFINQSVFGKINQNKINELKQNFEELEGLTWGMFHSDQPKPAKGSCSDPRSNENNYVLGKRHRGNKMVTISWMDNEEEKKNLLMECYVIKLGKDIRNIIRHFAKDGENEMTYLMVNNWIYEVDPQTLYVYPVGKRLINKVKQSISVQMGKESYPNIKAGIHGDPTDQQSPEVKCVQYFKNIFLGDPANIQPVEKEAWCTTYFVASVIAESARNFRTFPLILMALDLTEKETNMRDGLRFLFDEHSMTRGGSWIDPSRRGFSGSATPEGSSKLENQEPKTKEELLDDLKHVIGREDNIFTKWKNLIKLPHNNATYFRKMAEIAEKFKVLKKEEKAKFITDCQTFFNTVKNQQNLPSASGSSASMIRKRSNIQPEVNK